MLQQALIDVFGLSKTFGTVFAKAAFPKFVNPADKKVSLCYLLTNIHSTAQPSHSTGIEHYASLSREDRYDTTVAGDRSQRSPNPSQSNIVLESSSDKNFITIPDIVRAREKLWMKTYTAKPALQKDRTKTQEHIIADTEACLFLGALSGNSNQGKLQISIDYAKSILQEEKFPAGWKKSNPELGILRLISCLAQQKVVWAASKLTALSTLAKHWLKLE
jgi:hypothetical protein